jgi:hypothetical protein
LPAFSMFLRYCFRGLPCGRGLSVSPLRCLSNGRTSLTYAHQIGFINGYSNYNIMKINNFPCLCECNCIPSHPKNQCARCV